MARFTSPFGSLTLQGDGDAAPYAQFEGGAFTTTYPDTIGRLRGITDGSVIEVEDAAAEDATDASAPRRAKGIRTAKASAAKAPADETTPDGAGEDPAAIDTDPAKA